MNIAKQLEQRFSGVACVMGLQAFPMGYVSNGQAGQHKGKEKNTLILEVICDPDTYIWYSFFGENIEISTIVGSILNGTMELRLPQELHYSINGTVCDYLYFLVDGIYPKWPIFISTISDTTPGSKVKLFATYQEAVRNDIEQSFGVIVKHLIFYQDQLGFGRKR